MNGQQSVSGAMFGQCDSFAHLRFSFYNVCSLSFGWVCDFFCSSAALLSFNFFSTDSFSGVLPPGAESCCLFSTMSIYLRIFFRAEIIAVLAVSISLLGIFLLLYEMYRVAKEYARSSQLDRENQLLAVESRRYMELRSYLEQTRHLRHDFRQHLHVISGLTEAGRLDELKSYLSQYESELSDARPTLCVNAAVDALAGHYDYEARKQGIQIEWKLELPKLLPLPEADLCTILGNLLENALHASQKLPPEERQVKVLARMLSPAMMGLMVENRYDGVLKKQGGVLHSTKHDGQGIGLVSVETAVHRYHGNLTVETSGNVFRANVLLNL